LTRITSRLLLAFALLAFAAPASAALDSAPPWPFPGLYTDGQMAVSVHGSIATILSARPCADLLQALAAGEWSLSTPVEAPSLGEGMPPKQWAVLSRGKASALVQATGNKTCAATVSLVTSQRVTATGAVAAKGSAHAYPISCATVDTAGTTAVIVAYEGPGRFRALLNVTVAPKTGKQTLDGRDLVAGIGQTSQSAIAASFEFEALAAGQPTSSPPALGMFQPGDNFRGQASIASLAPLSGTVALKMLAGDAGEESITAGFSC
jgi:hypothetical protein